MDAWNTYLVESYRPGLSAQEMRAAAAILRRSACALRRESRPVRYVRSTIVPADEAFLSLFRAASEALVREACARAGLTADRISEAIEDTVPTTAKELP